MPHDGNKPALDASDDIDPELPDKAADESLADGPVGLLVAFTKLTLRFPITTLAIAIGTAAICAIYAYSGNLPYKTSRLDLLNPKSRYNKLWIDYVHEFGDEDDVVVVVEGENREQIVPALAEISRQTEHEKRYFHDVFAGVDPRKLRAKWLYQANPAQRAEILGKLEFLGPIVSGGWSDLQVGNQFVRSIQMLQAANAGMLKIDPATVQTRIENLASSLLVALKPETSYQSPWPEMSGRVPAFSDAETEYTLINHDRVGIVLLRITVDNKEIARGGASIDALKQIVADVSAKNPSVKIGLTGMPILENDEMQSSESSMFWGGIASFILVIVVVIAGFGGFRHAFLTNLTLLIGTGWAFGYATLVVGHLNILSVTFTASLIGIGVDYGTYYVSRYMQLRRNGVSCDEALLKTSHKSGPAIITGAMTTVVAFFATGATSFTGIAELGIIAGGGILLCALAQLFVLPPMIAVVDRSRLGQRIPHPVPVHNGIALLMKAPRLIIFGGVVVTLIAGIGMTRLWVDDNLLNLQPRGLESVELEKRLLNECGQSMWYAISTTDDLKELDKRKAKFRELSCVDRVEDVASWINYEVQPSQQLIQQVNQHIANLPARPPQLGVDAIGDTVATLSNVQKAIASTSKPSHSAQLLQEAIGILQSMPPAEAYRRISQFQQQMAVELLSGAQLLKSMASPEPPLLTDIPEGLRKRFVSKNNKYLLRIFGRGDIWDKAALENFVTQVRSVDPQATGHPLQTYECSKEMFESYKMATYYSLGIIFVVLWLSFRKLKYCAMAAVPPLMGIIVTFGLLGFMNQPMNPANLMAVPMILGIGVDYAVYIMHEYLEQKGRYRMSPGTAIAVTVDSLTTLIGYGSLLLATHQGLQSLGRVLTLAVAFCTAMSVLVLPAFLTIITRKRPLVPWVGDAVESYDHDEPLEDDLELEEMVPARRAA
jgi:hopanoid biosynthesis associated RND transporter like protein HpnN